MDFRLSFAASARSDIEEAFGYIYGDSPEAAVRWLRRLEQSLDDLLVDPLVFDPIPESHSVPSLSIYRSFNHHSHRVIYSVHPEEETVRIHRLYHGSRKPIRQRDIPER